MKGDGFLFSIGDRYSCTCGKRGPKSELWTDEEGVIRHPPLTDAEVAKWK